MDVKVYPTFAEDFIQITSDLHLNFSVYDMTGRLIDSNQIAGNTLNFPVPTLKKGIYLIVFTDGNNQITQRFVKK